MRLILTDPTLNVLLEVISRVNQELMAGVLNESRKRSQLGLRKVETFPKDLAGRL